MKGRVKAFTIMEVVISMLLAAIVIAITYTVYTIVVKSYGSYNIKHGNMAALVRLDELLRKDFEKAQTINKTETGLSCTNGEREVIYEFATEGIVRTSGITDTFKVQIQTANFFFEQVPFSDAPSGGEESRIDELKLELLFGEKTISNSYTKHYSSANLIQRKNNALN